LLPEESLVVSAIIEKTPGVSWETIAKKLGISRRQLFNVRRSPRVQEALRTVAQQLLRSDLGDVLKVLTEKAKAGDNTAMRLFLEVVDKYDEAEKATQARVDPTAWLRAHAGPEEEDDPHKDNWNQ